MIKILYAFVSVYKCIYIYEVVVEARVTLFLIINLLS